MLPVCFRSRRLIVALTLAVLGALASTAMGAASRVRHEVAFPELPGYTTLRCDFHMHTVFSDGLVWPTLRVEEAWRDGLDVIAITDHNESQRYKDDVPPKIGRSYELARPTAEGLGLLLIRACEITRDEPPGHLNALFVKDIAAVPDLQRLALDAKRGVASEALASLGMIGTGEAAKTLQKVLTEGPADLRIPAAHAALTAAAQLAKDGNLGAARGLLDGVVRSLPPGFLPSAAQRQAAALRTN